MSILVFCEAENACGLELLSRSYEMAPQEKIIALCEENSPCLAAASDCGADMIRILRVQKDDCAQGSRIAQAIDTLAPDIALFPATIRGRFLSAWVAARLKTGLTADCTDLCMNENALLKQVRPAFGGNLTAEILCKYHRPQMASVRPGIFTVKHFGKAPAEPEFLELPFLPERLILESFTPVESGISLQNAKVIVAGGKGIGSAKGFEKLRRLADLLGGAVGATRSAVDAGWIGYEHQIGQTGIVVHPKLYLAFGISGLIQHTVGMNASEHVIAVNQDRNAPIFNCADEGIIADWEETADAMIAALS